MSNVSFTDYVRQEGLTTRGVVLAWLENHRCVSPRQLAVETDDYYNANSYRVMINVMWQAGHLTRLGWGVYIKGSSPPLREAYSLPTSIKLEMGMLAQVMPSKEVARLYDVNRRTVEKYSHEYQRSHTSRAIQE